MVQSNKTLIFFIIYIFVSLIIICFLSVQLNKNLGNYCYLDLNNDLHTSNVCKHGQCDSNGQAVSVIKFIKLR